MNKRFFIFSLLLCMMEAAIQAAGFSPALDGSMMPYDFSAVEPLPESPAGYRPVHISYVARHGARFLSSPKKIEKVEKYLYDAAKHRNLSKSGEEFFELLRTTSDSTGSRWGLLSPVGIAEEIRLGRDMAGWFPDLLKSGRVNGISTYVPRVVMTMYQFNHSLERSHTHLELYSSAGRQNDSLLRFFAVAGPYCEYRDSGAWETIYNRFLDDHVPTAPARRLLKVSPEANLRKLRKMTMEMYGVLQASRAAGFEPQTDRWFSEKEFSACWEASNLLHWLRNTPTPVNNSAVSSVAPLIRRIIEDADKALMDSTASQAVIDSYFGHAETLLPLLSTLGLPGCYSMTEDYDSLAEEWKLQDITPLGANLMIVYLKSEDPDAPVMTLLRLNGRNIPAFPEAPLFLPWNELRSHWSDRILNL